MKHPMIKSALVALTFSLCAGLSLAAASQPAKPKQASASEPAKAAPGKAKAAAPKVEPVDINSASKDELKKLPGVGDAEADKIIAGRPYLTKAHLVTHKVISEGLYQSLRDLIVARQKNAKFAKEAKKK